MYTVRDERLGIRRGGGVGIDKTIDNWLLTQILGNKPLNIFNIYNEICKIMYFKS